MFEHGFYMSKRQFHPLIYGCKLEAVGKKLY